MSFRIATGLLVAWTMALGQPTFAQLETRASFIIGAGNPLSVVVGDFNGDGILDLAEVNFVPYGSVEILLGNGDGTFHHFSPTASASSPNMRLLRALGTTGYSTW